MMKKLCVFFLAIVCLLLGCSPADKGRVTKYSVGFAVEQLPLTRPLQEYNLAGYRNGVSPTGVLDLQCVRGVWIDNGKESILLISVDCIGLDSGTVWEIRNRLKAFAKESGCQSINVTATHTHAGVDTLGLWGDVGVNGKNQAFMDDLIAAAVRVAKTAYERRSEGKLYYGKIRTEGLQHDSRNPQSFDEHLYQVRFEPKNINGNGVRILSFAAHAEALRGDNRLISRDYPGVVCDEIKKRTGDDVVFLAGGVGGLIMTPEFVADNAKENLQITGRKIAHYALSIDEEKELSLEIKQKRVTFQTDLENTLFIYYKFLGILQNEISRKPFGRYSLKSEITAISLGEILWILLPGEIFPELIFGTGNAADPEGLLPLAKQKGREEVLFVGLANDELGYILPPSDFVLHPTAPYIEKAEGHYEETNSVGKNCAHDLTKAYEKALQGM